MLRVIMQRLMQLRIMDQSDELDRIVKAIMDNVSSVNKEDAETIVDSVSMIKMNCWMNRREQSFLMHKLLAPMISIVNRIPTLTTNIQNLIDFASQFLEKYNGIKEVCSKFGIGTFVKREYSDTLHINYFMVNSSFNGPNFNLNFIIWNVLSNKF